MQVILLEKIGKLGNLGDIVNIKNGYARNYLIPKGKAKRATSQNIEDFKELKLKLEEKQKEILEKALSKKSFIEEKSFTIYQKAGVDGKLFGSVTAMDIIKVLKDNAIEEVAKSNVRLPNGSLKNIGDYEISVVLHHDVVAIIKLKILPLSE